MAFRTRSAMSDVTSDGRLTSEGRGIGIASRPGVRERS